MNEDPDLRVVTTEEFAKATGYHQDSIRRMIAKGALRARRIGKNGRWMIPISEMRKLT